jgi:cellulose synthase/poly-beta-1,6-N-acetylglucosamine synthase-like glycosyltransferase
VGGWREDSLAEDTDITFRLVLGGWKVAYSNRYECYEEVPESWPARSRQIMRWAQGHTDAAIRYGWGMFRQPGLRMRERIDGALLLGTYLLSPLIIVGWFLALFLYMLGANPLLGVIAILSIAAYGTVGNFAAFFEIAAAARLDGTYGRIQLLPLVLMGFLVSVVASSRAVVRQLFRHRRSPFEWDKTDRYRTAAPPEFEPNNRNSNHDAAGTAGRRDKA